MFYCDFLLRFDLLSFITQCYFDMVSVILTCDIILSIDTLSVLVLSLNIIRVIILSDFVLRGCPSFIQSDLSAES
jgi:hypothetical protein